MNREKFTGIQFHAFSIIISYVTNDELSFKEQLLERTLLNLRSVLVAYSGGVDSSLLAFYARKVLGGNAKIVIAISASLAKEELDAARAQAQVFSWDLIEVATDELENPDYLKNDHMRCYFCKQTLFSELAKMADSMTIEHIAYGANMDDKQDFRPGHKAAKEFQVVSPLQNAGLEKSEIRRLARNVGLPSWDRPQAACLSSRIPTFERISVENLSVVDQAEQYLHSLGFRQVRVRHYGTTAKVEVDKQELPRLLNDTQLSDEVCTHMKKLGYSEVLIDREGYQQGAANTFINR